ncbi:hypothetical protein JCM19992_00520 [Thermostilla marina]
MSKAFLHLRRFVAVAVTLVIVLWACRSFAQDRPMLDRIRGLDANGDKAISKDEAGDAVWSRLGKLDRDGDGKVTLAEIQKRLQSNSGARNPAANVAIREPEGFDERYIYKRVGEVELPLYVYKPPKRASDAPVPAIVFFHGGGWKGGSAAQFEGQCRHFADRGMVAVTVTYRLISQPSVKVDDCVEDALDAMRWVRGHARELGIDPSRIAAAGGSAGGYLAACTALLDTREADTSHKPSAAPNAMILFNPALITAPDPRLNDEANTKLKALAALTRGKPERLSPLAYAKQKQPPCIMFFGTEDRLLLPAKMFRDDSVAAGNNCKIVTYAGQGHGFFNRGEYYEKTLAEADRFLVELGWLPAQR